MVNILNTNPTELSRWLRHWIVRATTVAGSGHVTSSLSAVELLSTLFASGLFHFDTTNPRNSANDRLLFSKGHASPLFYAVWAAAGGLDPEELLTLRKFGSRLEGHPTLAFPFTEAPTGSLGQGLGIGAGMALHMHREHNTASHVFVLLGDGEMAEGSNWEALQLAAHYKLSNLIGMLDVSGLEQVGETLYSHGTTDNGAQAFEQRIRAFGWQTIVVDGHDVNALLSAYEQACHADRPTMIIARTVKGKGVSLVEGKNNWHGKALNQEQEAVALSEIGEIEYNLRVALPAPMQTNMEKNVFDSAANELPTYSLNDAVATRTAYGDAVLSLTKVNSRVVALDAGVSNSTVSNAVAQHNPDSFFEMYIAEQNMVSMASGMALCGDIPFVSTFAAFFSRAFDQIRMSGYALANCKFVGSHAGCSIGQDGVSQMGLEDIALFRSIPGCVVLYPSDAVSMYSLTMRAAEHTGPVYIRSTREATPVLYANDTRFEIGGSHTVRQSQSDVVTLVAAGITLHEALKAHDVLQEKGVSARVIDLYSIVPLDHATLEKALQETGALLTVEDHYSPGGIGEAVRSALASKSSYIRTLSVQLQPKSGTPAELLAYEKIDSLCIVDTVLAMLAESAM